MPAEYLLCKDVAQQIESELRNYNLSHKSLATILTSTDKWSLQYEKLLKKDCARLNIGHQFFHADSDESLTLAIHRCNSDKKIQGVLLFYPLGNQISLDRYDIANSIDHNKDVEGLHCLHLGKLAQRYEDQYIVPATAGAIVKVLQHHDYQFNKNRALILNRSDIVGKPLRFLLEHLGMTVLNVYEATSPEFVERELSQFDLIITAVPDPEYRVPSAHVKEGATLIAVNSENIDVDGQIDPVLLEKCSLITSKKQPIGRVTRKITLLNMLNLSQH